MIPYSASLESSFADMSADEKAAFCEENKCSSQIDKIVTTGCPNPLPPHPPNGYVYAPARLILTAATAPRRYHTLKLIHFYTAGSDEVKCWTIRDGWTAPKAAGTIHTDFERGFIKAEGYNWDDWKAVLNEDASHERGKLAEASVKEGGKYRQASRAAHPATLLPACARRAPDVRVFARAGGEELRGEGR